MLTSRYNDWNEKKRGQFAQESSLATEDTKYVGASGGSERVTSDSVFPVDRVPKC